MEKAELQEWEDTCIQEEPPPCMTGCPIHVDARSFVKQVALGTWEDALKTMAKTMPFPRILGRICDHPCESTCRRSEVGESIAISSLERTCVETAREKVRGVMLPRKQTRVAVIGSGLSSLTASWDLLRKGYQVTIFEPTGRLGGTLWNYPESILPPEVITRELQLLEEIGATIELGSDISGSSRLAALRAGFDALFVGLDTVGVNCNGLERDDKGSVWCNALTRGTSMEGVFAGGNSIRNGNPSPIYDVLDGRKAATSIDRYTMNLNQENGRDLEGPYPSRLYTNTGGVSPLPRVSPAGAVSGYTADEAIAEAGRCLQCECLECVKVCLYLDRNNGYPKKYARQVFNSEYVMHGRAHTKNLFVNSCSACGLCETVCPNNFHVGEMMLKERRTFLRKNFMPPSFHEFALLDMEQSNSERCALSRHEPGRDESSWLYFPSCQLSATTPVEIQASYAYLREKLEGGVGIMLGCCGAPAHWAGRDDLFQELQAGIRREWERLGRPTVITACSTCRSMFQEQQPEMETRTLWDVVASHCLPSGYLPHQGETVSITDPCMARHDATTHGQVRELARSLGFSINELPLSGEKAECCGFGGLMFNADPALAKDVIRHRTTVIDPPDTNLYRPTVMDNDYLAYCAMCRDNLAAGGKRTSHLIEHLFPGEGMSDPAARGWISWTERRHNRVTLREAILGLYGEEERFNREEHDMITLFMTEEVRRRADDRRILESDIRRVIHHAEESGKRLHNSATGVYRSYHKIGNVTFWVEYTPVEDGYTIHNAYCHRMNIVGALK
jgi:NADPH-dependent glutamate synthase beta subunit-like oxidoreductase